MSKFYCILFFFIAIAMSAQIKISPELNERLQDSIKPKNTANVTVNEAAKIIRHAYPDNIDLIAEYDRIAAYIENQVPKLTNDQKAEVYHALMLYSFNLKERYKLMEYSNLCLKYIDLKNPRNYRKISSCHTNKAFVFSTEKKFSDAIDNCNLSLKYAEKIKDFDGKYFVYQVLISIYQTTSQYEKAIYYNSLYRNYNNKNSPNYNIFRYRYPTTEVTLNLLNYLKTKKESCLERAEFLQDSIAKTMMKELEGKWLFKWHINNAYIFYFKENYKEAEKEFLESEKIQFRLKNWATEESKSFQALLYLKTGRGKEAVAIFENYLQNQRVFGTLLYREIYNYFKSVNNLEKANFYLEKLMASEAFENNYKLQGEIILANNKYNVREKQYEIKQLSQKASIEKSQNQLKFAVLSILLLISLSFLIFINRQSKIKRLKQEQRHQEKMKLMEESLSEVDNKLFLERKSIGENIHNDLLGDLVALRYLTDDFAVKATDAFQKNAFTGISKELDSIYTQSRSFSHTLTTGKSNAQISNIFEYMEGIKERFSEAGLLDIDYHIPEDKKDKLVSAVPFKIQKVIHSLIKESVANTIKHSDAKKISIAFDFSSPGLLEITIKDNGKVFSKKEHKGIGLESLREQILSVGGSFDFNGMQDGFQTTSTIPIAA